MKFQVIYHEKVVNDDIVKLGLSDRRKIQSAIETKIVTQPDLYGKPLRRSLRGYRKLRVGDYRIVFRIEGHRIKILAIMHRSVVYKKAEKRFK